MLALELLWREIREVAVVEEFFLRVLCVFYTLVWTVAKYYATSSFKPVGSIPRVTKI